MNISNLNIIEELERLAAECPWETVDIWLSRTAEGHYHFTACAGGNTKFALEFASANAATPGEAVDSLLKSHPVRTPEVMRVRKIAELKAQIEKLQGVIVGLPPYKPGTILTNGDGEATIKAPETIEV